MPKESSNEKTNVPNGFWFRDITNVKVPQSLEIMVTYPVWHIIVDKATGTKISGFYKAKNAMVKPICEHIHNMKGKWQPVLKLQQENLGETRNCPNRLNSWSGN